jgi:hypothetical protein
VLCACVGGVDWILDLPSATDETHSTPTTKPVQPNPTNRNRTHNRQADLEVRGHGHDMLDESFDIMDEDRAAGGYGGYGGPSNAGGAGPSGGAGGGGGGAGRAKRVRGKRGWQEGAAP